MNIFDEICCGCFCTNDVLILKWTYLIRVAFSVILKNHILPNIICSAPIQGHVRTPNLLGQHLQLHRDEDGKLFVNSAQIVVRDIMTTNGVLYLIDEVLVPDGGKSI